MESLQQIIAALKNPTMEMLLLTPMNVLAWYIMIAAFGLMIWLTDGG